jgi:hypothetical protein
MGRSVPTFVTVLVSGWWPVRWLAMADGCVDCGAVDTGFVVDGVRLCDRCADRRIAARTGWPELPDPPAPRVVVGPDGRTHTMRIRLHRAATGVVAEAVELGSDPGEGHQVQVIGAHDVDVPMLVEQLHLQVREEIGTAYLEPNPHRPGWLLRDREVRGRLVWNGENATYAVAVDGRTLSWEFGRTLESYEGWRFRLVVDDIDDVRPEAAR